mgnify:CR=1 FL=1
MSDDEQDMATCGACQAEVPANSIACPTCSVSFSGIVEENLGECGACGAKVGGKVLEKVLGKLPSNIPEMTNRIGDDAAVLNLTGSLKVLTTDHLRKFCNDPWKMAKITAIHSLGDIWAMGADPVAVLSHITIPEVHRRLRKTI